MQNPQLELDLPHVFSHPNSIAQRKKVVLDLIQFFTHQFLMRPFLVKNLFSYFHAPVSDDTLTEFMFPFTDEIHDSNHAILSEIRLFI